MGIVRKSKKVSALNFDPKGVKKGAPCDPGPKDPPPNPNRVNRVNSGHAIVPN